MTPRLSRATSASSLRTPRVHAARVREVQLPAAGCRGMSGL